MEDDTYITIPTSNTIYTLDDSSMIEFSDFTTIKSEFDVSDATVDGVTLSDELATIKKQLLLLSRDVNMEEKYPELKKAYDEYNSILKRLTAMEKITDSNYTE